MELQAETVTKTVCDSPGDAFFTIFAKSVSDTSGSPGELQDRSIVAARASFGRRIPTKIPARERSRRALPHGYRMLKVCSAGPSTFRNGLPALLCSTAQSFVPGFGSSLSLIFTSR